VNNTGLNKTIIEGGDLHLNGVALNDLILPTNGTLSATAVAAWLNQQTDATGVAAQATNLLKVESSRLSLGSSLELNNVAVPGAETVSSAQALVAVINQASMQTNVEAYLDSEGHITLANSPGHQGEPILVTSADVDGQNTLGIDAKSYSGQLVLTGAGSIQFDLITSAGHSGKPALLSALGLQTGLYFSGTLPEDMVVMVAAAETGATRITAKSGGLIDATNAPRTMEPAFSVAFSADGTYTLTEIESGSVLAKRTYDHSVGIQQGDLTITFDQVPSAGDQFLIQPRDADSGNNDMIVALAELQNASVFVGGNTFSSGYLKILNEVGSNSFSATIASDALEVVYQQAVEKRDSKVGVSLDQEAASLIRFQQAFQAAAQIIQTSSKLFDTILGASR
jgi:flagellar hook-associated protein FlgK